MLRPVTLGLRGLFFLMALTVLALAAALIANQVYGTAPVTTRYCTFTGGFGMIAVAVAALCGFVSSVPDLVPVVLDGLAGLLFLGGGIAWAYGLKDTSNCSDARQMLLNPLLNQGSLDYGKGPTYGVIQGPEDTDASVTGRLRGNCQRAQADEVLQFLCFGIAVGLVAIGMLQRRNGGGGRAPAGAYV